ncbi:uncharacterized protein QC761_0024170 [Podospora bellae-mahoneyi]|uniref:Protein kinase domain-containing protein n=1 Tax=Podospora bellae-mahoneyi TaxID=2093777 RepID=A0ABR0G1T2_9PEZI|nr:hypothetical protein QC761_0024170 [Podospora bellae-mahoneyi]
MEDDEDCGTKDIQFGFRRFRAPAKRIYANRNVFLLDVPPNPIASWLLFWMPQLVCWLQRLLPEWFLPTTVILKERNPTKADDYENEIDTYLHLRSLQGTHIPRLFGEVTVSDPHAQRYRISKRPTPAILLENVEGVSLYNLPTEELGNPDLLRGLKDIYNLLTEKGVVHGDPKLHNFLRVDQRIVAIDFELSNPLPSDITNELELRDLVSEIAQREKQAQGAGSKRLVSGVYFIEGGLQVRTDLRSSSTTTYNEQRGDEGLSTLGAQLPKVYSRHGRVGLRPGTIYGGRGGEVER